MLNKQFTITSKLRSRTKPKDCFLISENDYVVGDGRFLRSKLIYLEPNCAKKHNQVIRLK